MATPSLFCSGRSTCPTRDARLNLTQTGRLAMSGVGLRRNPTRGVLHNFAWFQRMHVSLRQTTGIACELILHFTWRKEEGHTYCLVCGSKPCNGDSDSKVQCFLGHKLRCISLPEFLDKKKHFESKDHFGANRFVSIQSTVQTRDNQMVFPKQRSTPKAFLQETKDRYTFSGHSIGSEHSPWPERKRRPSCRSTSAGCSRRSSAWVELSTWATTTRQLPQINWQTG